MSSPAQRILHPTDFSAESDLAMAHALRIALANQAKLILLHVSKSGKHEHFPSVRETLQRWGMIGPNASRSEVAELGIGIEKIEAYGGSVAGSVANYLDHHPVDMLVMTTHGRQGLASWLDPSTAEEAARRTETPTLFVPVGCRGCVSPADGAVSMRQVLVPIDHQPSSQDAVERGMRALDALGEDNAKLTLLHVGEPKDFPRVDVSGAQREITRVCRQGSPVAEILAQAAQSDADLLIMATEGRHGFFDALRGSTTEQVLHDSPCPVLAVPAIPES